MLPRLRLALAAAVLAALLSHPAAAADDVVWVYPLPNSLVKESPVSIYGYLRGAPQESLEAKVMSADGSGGPSREPLVTFKGKVFSGSIGLRPGRNNVLVSGAVLPLFYKPETPSDREGDFRLPRAHAGKVESCNQCHTFTRGEIALKQRLPDLCLSCHKLGTESDRTSMKRTKRSQSITPDCLRCHEAHASFEPRLLKTARGVCTACHEALKGYVHDPKAPGDGCGVCHDAHSSAYPLLLKGDALALCVNCHKEVASPAKYPKSFHTPVTEGKCFDCHTAHPAGQPHLAKAASPGLCRACHKPKREGPHQGKLDNCRTCHEAHRSTRPSLLVEGSWDECLRCHPAQKVGLKSHPALKEGCGACHDPHDIGTKREAEQACGRCHRLSDPPFQAAHGGLAMGETKHCATCHDAHGSNFPALLRGQLHYPLKNGGCAACHTGKEGKVDLRYEGSDNCLRCHGQITGTSVIKEVDKVHKPVNQIDCTACHNPHFGTRPKLLLEEPVTLCGWCHGTVLRGASNVHGVFAQGGTCYTCHLPHISDFKPLLKRPEEELCVRCHQKVLPEGPASRRLVHGALQKGRCTGCHNPHGTNTERLLRSSRDTLCAACHKEALLEPRPETTQGKAAVAAATRDVPWKFLHGPVATGNCTACHELKHQHKSGDDQFLKAKGSKVCGLCHETKPEHVRDNFRSKMREVQNDCLACHLPHGGPGKFLLIPLK